LIFSSYNYFNKTDIPMSNEFFGYMGKSGPIALYFGKISPRYYLFHAHRPPEEKVGMRRRPNLKVPDLLRDPVVPDAACWGSAILERLVALVPRSER
jgi:hypothetical protein